MTFEKDAALWAIATGILGFLAKEGYQIWRKGRDSAKERGKFLLALEAEIELNNAELARFIDKFYTATELQKFLAHGRSDKPVGLVPTCGCLIFEPNRCFRPMLFAYNFDIVLNSKINLLPTLDDPIIKMIIKYYGTLDVMKKLVETIDSPRFCDISLPSRLEYLLLIKSNAAEARELGDAILGAGELTRAR